MDRWIFSQNNNPPPDEIIHFTLQDTRLYDGKRIIQSSQCSEPPKNYVGGDTLECPTWLGLGTYTH